MRLESAEDIWNDFLLREEIGNSERDANTNGADGVAARTILDEYCGGGFETARTVIAGFLRKIPGADLLSVRLLISMPDRAYSI